MKLLMLSIGCHPTLPLPRNGTLRGALARGAHACSLPCTCSSLSTREGNQLRNSLSTRADKGNKQISFTRNKAPSSVSQQSARNCSREPMHRSGHMQVETVFQPRELDLNGPDFAEGHRSYEQCVAEAHRIASPRARSEDEAAKTRPLH